MYVITHIAEDGHLESWVSEKKSTALNFAAISARDRKGTDFAGIPVTARLLKKELAEKGQLLSRTGDVWYVKESPRLLIQDSKEERLYVNDQKIKGREAAFRLSYWELPDIIGKEFTKNGRVFVSDADTKTAYPLSCTTTPDIYDQVESFEEDEENLVYHVVKDGDGVELLYVSSFEDEWDAERVLQKSGFAYAAHFETNNRAESNSRVNQFVVQKEGYLCIPLPF